MALTALARLTVPATGKTIWRLPVLSIPPESVRVEPAKAPIRPSKAMATEPVRVLLPETLRTWPSPFRPPR